jgi:7-carboxy-7-deazaguanine synthase
MVKQIIPAFKKEIVQLSENSLHLRISEFFCDTIQGEGIYAGYPAAFLRFQHCTLDCCYCDTTEVWHQGNQYGFNEIMDLMDQVDLPRKLFEGQHLVLTGGSPLMQQKKIVQFLDAFEKKYEFLPFIEIENECTIVPIPQIINKIKVWNNSPKLSGSGVPSGLRYKPEILTKLTKLKNSWFKFVVDCEEDWEEILMNFIQPGLIKKEQIIIMPEGATRKALESNRIIALEMAIKHNVRYTDRLHIQIWDKKVGV